MKVKQDILRKNKMQHVTINDNDEGFEKSGIVDISHKELCGGVECSHGP